MSYNIVLTTAEDIVAVVDAIVAKGSPVEKAFILDFTGIATEDQVLKALHMASELGLVLFNNTMGLYQVNSFLAKKLVTSLSDEEKAIFMRLIIEQYPPYNSFKERYEFTKSIDLACRQIKSLYSMQSHERDIKNTLISIATYAKALKSEGANLYHFIDSNNSINIIEYSLQQALMAESTIRSYWGDSLYSFVDKANVFDPLCDAFLKTKSDPLDTKAIVVYASNAFESFLGDFASHVGVSLAGKTGIIQKRDALIANLSKKHRGMIDYIGQIRNAADHGADCDEGNQTWIVTNETAMIFPTIIAIVIKDIYMRSVSRIIEV